MSTDQSVDVVFTLPKSPREEAREEGDRISWKETEKRIKLSMLIADGAKCAHCGHIYSSVEDMLSRDPLFGYGTNLVDSICWDEYVRTKPFVGSERCGRRISG